MTLQTSRREFLQGAATAGLVIGLSPSGAFAATPAQELSPNPFVTIGEDGTVTVILKHFEMGQGTSTGLTTLVAEELDADWDAVEIAFAPADASRYVNTAFGAQGTGGSTAIANSFVQYRQAGAAARDLLVRAAAAEWSVPAEEIIIENSVLKHASGKESGFGPMTGRAATLTVAEELKLKDPSEFKLIGRETLARKDNLAKTTGAADFAIDIRRPNMLTVVVARAPMFGGKPTSVNDEAALATRGVEAVRVLPEGVAVYATDTWSAMKGREALEVEWDLSAAETRSSAQILEDTRALLEQDGQTARKDGDGAAALAGAAKTVEADFLFPFLAHSPMEPLNCVIERTADGGVEIWDGCQFPSLAQPTVAAVMGVDPAQVKINTVWAGGSFGRRANPTSDYHAEAALALKMLEGSALEGRPVHLVWTREDDVRGGYYRPAYAHRVRAGVDADGHPVAWDQRQSGKSILIGTFFEEMLVQDGVDGTSVEGASTLPYAVPNLEVSIRNTETPIKVLWWRAVGHTHTAYSTEVIMDMLAEAANADPVEYRLSLLGDHPRHAGVLKLAAEKAGWNEPLPEGRGRGVAVHESFSSFVATVVEVSTNEDGAVKIERVVTAVDCGLAINPDVIKAQLEGGTGFGLGSVMRNQITLTDGEVDQTNFWDYEPLRLSDMPPVEVHIVPSAEAPTGVGEPGTPPAGPALANAIYAATGKRAFTLPMTESGIEFA